MGRLRIVSSGAEPFVDRQEAGRLLGWECSHLRNTGALVLGPPGAGMIVANQVAAALDAELDVVLCKEMRVPGDPGIAFGSISEAGIMVLNEAMVEELDIPKAYIAVERETQQSELARLVPSIRRMIPRVPIEGRVVILVDDGIAAGGTLQAALWSVDLERPKTLIIGIPVGPEDGITRLADDADITVCLKVPPVLTSLDQFYIRNGHRGPEEALDILLQRKSGRSRQYRRPGRSARKATEETALSGSARGSFECVH